MDPIPPIVDPALDPRYYDKGRRGAPATDPYEVGLYDWGMLILLVAAEVDVCLILWWSI
jgi:hypothetical protein